MNQPKKLVINEADLIYLEHVRIDKNKKRDCQCAIPHILIDSANDRVSCKKCRSIMEPMAALKLMGETRENRNDEVKNQFDQYELLKELARIENERVKDARAQLARLHQEIQQAERELAAKKA